MFSRKPQPQLIGKPEDIIYRLELNGTVLNSYGNKVDMYILYWDKQTEEMITLGIPHGREDIAQYIQERLNRCTTE